MKMHTFDHTRLIAQNAARPRNLLQSLLWTRHDTPSLEHGRLYEHHAGFILDGTVVGSLDHHPFHCAYEIAITDQWQTRELKIALSGADGEHYLCLRRDEENRWWEGGTDRELGALAGLTDIDLGISPSTNTLAIRRLRLQPGDSAAITAAWVRFPSLEISPLPQRYTRTGENTYRYESNDGAFQADLEIDEHALVTQYADIWSRI